MEKAPKGIKIEKLEHKTIIRYRWDRFLFFIHLLIAVGTSLGVLLFSFIVFMFIGFAAYNNWGFSEEMSFLITNWGIAISTMLTFILMFIPSIPYLFNYSKLELTEDDLHLTHHRFLAKNTDYYLPLASIKGLETKDGLQKLQQKLIIKGRKEQLVLKGMYPNMNKINFFQKLLTEHTGLPIGEKSSLKEDQEAAIEKLKDYLDK
jgi:magnesium-transporting ATPase (P-type)